MELKDILPNQVRDFTSYCSNWTIMELKDFIGVDSRSGDLNVLIEP